MILYFRKSGEVEMEEELYNLLLNENVFTHGIGLDNDPNTLFKLESIITNGGLYSKEQLRKKFGYDITGRVIGNIRFTKDSYISLFDPSLDILMNKILTDKIRELSFKLNDVTIMIDKCIESDLRCKKNAFDNSELIVEKHIPIRYFLGIIVPKDSNVFHDVIKLLNKYELNLPVYDTDGFLLNQINIGKLKR